MSHDITKLTEVQLKDPLGASFHETVRQFVDLIFQQHRESCYIFVGGLDKRLTEGDIITVFSEWGEIVDINLIRDHETGESKGFCFLAFEDQRSTDLAVDNGNGMRLLERNVKVDHVTQYHMTVSTKAIQEGANAEETMGAIRRDGYEKSPAIAVVKTKIKREIDGEEKRRLWEELKRLRHKVRDLKRQGYHEMIKPDDDSLSS